MSQVSPPGNRVGIFIVLYIRRRFAACKRSLNGMEVAISAKLPDNILAHSSHFRRWDHSRRGGRGGTWW